MKKFIGETL